MTSQQRIFLGHASEDKPKVRQLYHQLKAEDFAPWLDEFDLLPGQNWRVEIPKAIKSAAIFLACLSKQSVAKRSYVQREFRYALSAYADLPPDMIYLIPVRLDDCEVPDLRLPELELNLRDLHWVDLFDEDGFKRLVAAIRLNVTPDESRESKAKTPAPELKTVPPQPKPSPAPSLPQRNPLEVFRDIDALWCPEMVLLPAGTFLMGSPETEKGRFFDHEGPQHEVTISQPFALGRYPVTFAEYDHFCEQTGRKKPDDVGWGRDRLPVIYVSHRDAETYCAWLSEATGRQYHLPSEAQWEYACRAGTKTAYAFGDELTDEQANFADKLGHTSTVGAYPANAWGLHDMHGNVGEWCADWIGTYSSKAVTDPKGPSAGTLRVVRGGSWSFAGQNARAADRIALSPGYCDMLHGFRCAVIQEPPTVPEPGNGAIRGWR